MKLLEKLMFRRFAQPAVQLTKWFCYLVIFFYVFCLVLSCLGRQSFQLYTSTGVQENAIYAGADYDASHSLTVSMDDPVYVHGNAQGQVDLVTQIALSLMFTVKAVPAIIAYWLLVRVLGNIQGGKIFTEQNAVYLLGFGLLQGAVALVAPFLRMLLCSWPICWRRARCPSPPARDAQPADAEPCLCGGRVHYALRHSPAG